MPSILVLCHANQFRSVVTEYALRDQLDPALYQVSSAGVWAQDGLPAARGLAEWSGLPQIEAHRSRALHSNMILQCSLILVMERGQKEALRLEFPAAAGRIYLLSEMSSSIPYDIPDPALGGENPQQLIKEILALVQKGLPRITELARQPLPF